MTKKNQLHKRLTTEQVVAILDKQITKEITGKQAAAYLHISRRRFYQLRNEYEEKGSAFTIAYERTTPTRTISAAAEKHILRELEIEKTKIVDNPDVPTDRYNYSYVQKQLQDKHGVTVSVPTIITRAKENGYWKGRMPKKIHDREVITNYTGELTQHDASHHMFAPDSGKKWCLTTSLDDYSRALVYADFWEQETTWNHILAAQELTLSYGVPLKYYVDQLRVFRYVKSRDKQSPWREFGAYTDDVDPQWKQVVKDIGIEPVYALSPQAKGKIERPYRWLQDHIVRTCVREGIKTIEDARKILKQEVNDYNWKRIHSTTGEIPMRRMEAAVAGGKSLWREFKVTPPFTDTKDIFALRAKRIVDPYRKVSINKLKLKVRSVPPRQEVELRMAPDVKKGVTEVRFWFKGHCVGRQTVKLQELPIVKF
ncbi:MAG: hypothetical protein ACRD4B_09605 [Acidobacteriota bacterium]